MNSERDDRHYRADEIVKVSWRRVMSACYLHISISVFAPGVSLLATAIRIASMSTSKPL